MRALLNRFFAGGQTGELLVAVGLPVPGRKMADIETQHPDSRRQKTNGTGSTDSSSTRSWRTTSRCTGTRRSCGAGYAECHVVPLHVSGPTTTYLDDLVRCAPTVTG